MTETWRGAVGPRCGREHEQFPNKGGMGQGIPGKPSEGTFLLVVVESHSAAGTAPFACVRRQVKPRDVEPRLLPVPQRPSGHRVAGTCAWRLALRGRTVSELGHREQRVWGFVLTRQDHCWVPRTPPSGSRANPQVYNWPRESLTRCRHGRPASR